MEREVIGAFGWLEEEGRVCLVANWRTLAGERVLCWDLPGGGAEAGESLEDAVIREFREETGIPVRVRNLEFMIERFGFRGAPPDLRSRYYFFAVERAGPEERRTEERIVEVAWVAPETLAERCTQFYHRPLHAWLASGRTRRYFLDDPRKPE